MTMIRFLVLLSSLLLQVSAFSPPVYHVKLLPGADASPGTLPTRQSSSSSTRLNTLPKLIVFDLDNTLWTPELYQLRKLQRSNTTPKAGKDVHLMTGSQEILMEHIPALQQQGVQFGVASRTQSVEWAHALLGQFDLLDLFSYVQIVPGNKKRHFQEIQKASGIPYDSMLFFDDARDGKYGNCEPVAEMGVLAVHCPKGLESADIFTNALQQFKTWDKTPGTIVDADGSMSGPAEYENDSTVQYGLIKMINASKRYGFIRYRDGKSRDIFFHFRHLEEVNPTSLQEGDEVSFLATVDPKNGKKVASKVSIETSLDTSKVELKCFSMNQPFAALLANGYKDLETRNGTMFERYAPGTMMVLHVGQRKYPDEDRHIEVMKGGGLNDAEIEDLKSMPEGFGKGQIVAILELGRTFETTLAERSYPEFERRVAAFGADSGRLSTEIRRVAYLKEPVKMKGEPGVFKVRLDKDVIPDGWEISSTTTSDIAPSVYASISG